MIVSVDPDLSLLHQLDIEMPCEVGGPQAYDQNFQPIPECPNSAAWILSVICQACGVAKNFYYCAPHFTVDSNHLTPELMLCGENTIVAIRRVR